MPSGQSASSSRKVTFQWTCANERPSKVQVAGEFSEWKGLDMTQSQDGGQSTWNLSVQLPPARYMYKYIVDGTWMVDANAPTTFDPDNGFENNTILVEDVRPETPGQASHVEQHGQMVLSTHQIETDKGNGATENSKDKKDADAHGDNDALENKNGTSEAKNGASKNKNGVSEAKNGAKDQQSKLSTEQASVKSRFDEEKPRTKPTMTIDVNSIRFESRTVTNPRKGSLRRMNAIDMGNGDLESGIPEPDDPKKQKLAAGDDGQRDASIKNDVELSQKEASTDVKVEPKVTVKEECESKGNRTLADGADDDPGQKPRNRGNAASARPELLNTNATIRTAADGEAGGVYSSPREDDSRQSSFPNNIGNFFRRFSSCNLL